MTCNNLGPLLADIQRVLQSKGCKVTSVSVTIYSAEQEKTIDVNAIDAGVRSDSASRPVRGE